MSIFTKIAEFFTGKQTQPEVAATTAPYKVEPAAISTIEVKPSAPILEFPTSKKPKPAARTVTKTPAPTPEPTPKPRARKGPAPKPRVVTSPVVVKARFNAIELEKSSKQELLEMARALDIKVNARMGKSIIIAKLVK